VSLREAARSVPRRFYPVLPEPARTPSARLVGPVARAVPVRLTRRGYVVAALLATALFASLIWLAHASAVDAGPVGSKPPAVVTVESGDTLWSIASRIAPQRDPRAVVAELERVNHLGSPVLQPGQRLRTG
jgi:Tfp pilus assembly protein FimV